MTELDSQTENYQALVEQVGRLLPPPLRTFTLSYDIEQLLRPRLRVLRIHGPHGLPEVRLFSSHRDGHFVMWGLIEVELRFDDGARFHAVRFANSDDDCSCDGCDGLWFVRQSDYAACYRRLRRLSRRRDDVRPPLMPPADRERLWNNTLGFLQRGTEALARFGVPLKRGVLLMGQPGNGKTTACRWLEAEAARLGFLWRTVTAEMYQNYSARGVTSRLFDLDEPGIVLFDDLDQGLRDRDVTGNPVEQTTFLAELDGVRIRNGVVYLFTSNAGIDDLDPAFRRPGRIDHMIRFAPPPADLRRQFLHDYWPAEIVAAIPVDRAVAETEGLTFAELDELKKQLVLNFLDTGRWDWDEALGIFRIRLEEHLPKRAIGFAAV